jgi:hypothetical protein
MQDRSYSVVKLPVPFTAGLSCLYWDRGFESRTGHGLLSLCFRVVLFNVGRGLAKG